MRKRSHYPFFSVRFAFFVLNACFYIPYAHAEEHADALNTSSVETAPSHPDNGWDSNKEHYYENGQQVRSQEIYDAKEKTGIG